jgi:hypothetical protein
MMFASITSTSKDDPMQLIKHDQTIHGAKEAMTICGQTMHALWRTKSHRYQLP